MAVSIVQHDIEEGAPIIDDYPFDNHTKKILPDISENSSNSSNINGVDAFHENGESHDDHHGHAANPSYKSLIASSVVCFIIYFVFCIVFSSVV